MWKYYALLSALFAALTALFAKMGVERVNSDLALAIRVSFIFILVWAIAIVGGSARGVARLSGSVWLYLFLSAFATGLSWLFYFKALKDGDVSRVAPLDKLSVPLAIVLAIVFLGEKATWQVIVGGGFITIGSIVLLL